MLKVEYQVNLLTLLTFNFFYFPLYDSVGNLDCVY